MGLTSKMPISLKKEFLMLPEEENGTENIA